MKKLLLATIAIAAMSSNAMASPSVGVSLSNLSDDGISLQTLNVHAGYEFQLENPNFSITPEFRVGLGLGEDSDSGVDVEIDSFMVFSAKASYMLNEKTSVFLQPSYGKLRTTATLETGEQFKSKSDWELGAGFGVDYKVNTNTSLNFTYENIENTDILSAGFRYRF